MTDIKNNINDLIRMVYYPPIKQDANWSFQKYIGHEHIRFYSYARHALYEALKLCDLKQGDKVLIPGFICREVLSSLNEVGAESVFYDVTPDLQIKSVIDLPVAKVVIVVNYFGFPFNLDSISEYCSTNDTIVIEDNSHGFLSKDKDNKTLGTRTKIGIFSLRKTMPVINGAALVVNDPIFHSRLNKQLDYVSDSAECKHGYFKRTIKNIIPYKKYNLIFKLIKVKQALRNLVKGDPVIISSSESEYDLPYKPNPHNDIKEYMSTIVIDEEIVRRRLLYSYLVDYIGDDIDLIKKLEPNVAPYVFPFRCNDIDKVRNKLKNISLDCYKWPELPDKIQSSCPDHYKNIWMVPFLW